MTQAGSTAENGPEDRKQAVKALIDKPWFQEAYKSSLDFHSKDDVLDTKDRLELSQIYVSISRAQVWGGWASFAAVFGAPFGYQYYKTKAIRGVKVPRNFVFGLVAMAFSARFCGKAMYNSQLSKMRSNGGISESSGSKWNEPGEEINENIEGASSSPQISRNQRQYDMMNLLGYAMAPKWARYFYYTYTNPERRLPDPRKLMENVRNGEIPNLSPFLNQRDPLSLYSGPRHDEKKGIPRLGSAPSDSSNDTLKGTSSEDIDPFGHEEKNTRSSNLSSWDRVRDENGVSNGSRGDRWSQIRSAPGQYEQKPQQDSRPFQDKNVSEDSEDFDALLEKERRGEDSL
ncbi:LAFA_0G19174g1_1 [Lachancea sp. 'fantastica']|nr:LAFA_0G19174g1_1 [Lachancea sp. 'fantastica']